MAVDSKKKYDDLERAKERKFGVNYKWLALSNTTLGVLLAVMNGSIIIISLPAIFAGIGINPLTPSNIGLLIWLLLGYLVVSASIVVTIGRLSDMFGRVKLYNLGFLMFTISATGLYLSSLYFIGPTEAIIMIIMRLIEGIGAGLLFANSTAIITDAFPHTERGKAMGINMIAGSGGSLIGLIVGGILASIDWHLVFLVSVPVSIIGTVWAYLALHEIAIIKKDQHLDIKGNLLFASAIIILLISITYGLLPYGTASNGWSDPYVIVGSVLGLLLLAIFIVVERRAQDPMFHLNLFKIRAFGAGCLSLFMAGMAWGGLQFMLIIWLQGIWLPLHGVSFANTPLQAGIDMVPLIIGFLIMGPISGVLSDKYGARTFATLGMLLNVVGLLVLATFPANFNYIDFALVLFVIGCGQGVFAAPNTTAIMNSVPPEHRGSASGMRATLNNVSYMFSIIIFFTLLILGMSAYIGPALYKGLVAQNVSTAVAQQVASLPPTAAIFASFLGYNPIATLVPQSVLASLPPSSRDYLIGTIFFPTTLEGPFISGMQEALIIAAILAFISTIASVMRGPRYVYGNK